MRFTPIFLLLPLVILPLHAARAASFDAALFGELLQSYTSTTDDLPGTYVDYAGLREEPRWQTLLANLSQTDPRDLKDRGDRLAYWINAYNIFAIDLILRHQPEATINEIGSVFSLVWNKKAGIITGEVYSLNDIEHEILIPMGDPRVHSAIVCASRSCPSLSRVPWDPSHVGEQLDLAMRAWLGDEQKGMRIDRERNRIYLSKIFKWFGEDFDRIGGVRAVIQRYGPKASRSWLAEHGADASLRYMSYDWMLNAQPGRE